MVTVMVVDERGSNGGHHCPLRARLAYALSAFSRRSIISRSRSRRLAAAAARSANLWCTAGLTIQCGGSDGRDPEDRVSQARASRCSKIASVSCFSSRASVAARRHRAAAAAAKPRSSDAVNAVIFAVWSNPVSSNAYNFSTTHVIEKFIC